jgi:beta-galactosidase
VQTLFSDWTPASLAAHEENVEVYSNCQEVELLLNGKSLGSKPLAADASPRTWRVHFEAGGLQAVGKNQGRAVANYELRTAGVPAKIALAADRTGLKAEWDDVAYVTARVVDDHGTLVPNADPQIAFQVAGPGAIVAVDSADTSSHEPFQASARHAYQGQAIAIVRRAKPGRITVTASAPGLAAGKVEIQ